MRFFAIGVYVKKLHLIVGRYYSNRIIPNSLSGFAAYNGRTNSSLHSSFLNINFSCIGDVANS